MTMLSEKTEDLLKVAKSMGAMTAVYRHLEVVQKHADEMETMARAGWIRIESYEPDEAFSDGNHLYSTPVLIYPNSSGRVGEARFWRYSVPGRESSNFLEPGGRPVCPQWFKPMPLAPCDSAEDGVS